MRVTTYKDHLVEIESGGWHKYRAQIWRDECGMIICEYIAAKSYAEAMREAKKLVDSSLKKRE